MSNAKRPAYGESGTVVLKNGKRGVIDKRYAGGTGFKYRVTPTDGSGRMWVTEAEIVRSAGSVAASQGGAA